MLYQPSNITPSSFAGVGEGTVESAGNVRISWQINGNSPMTAFSIDIYKNDIESTLVHSTGTLNDGCPAYGTDAKGNIDFFVYAPDDTTWASWGLEDGNSYKLKITQYWGANNANSVVQYSDSVFITRTLPTIALNTITSPVTTISQTFTATYTQAQGDAINWVRWQFARIEDEKQIIIDDTSPINTGILSYTYDGLITGNTYAINCIIETENGVQVQTDFVSFDVEYLQETSFSDITAKCATEDGSVLLSWGAGLDIQGVATPTDGYSIANNLLTLNEGATIKWDTVNNGDMNFQPLYTVGWRGQISKANTAYQEKTLLMLSVNDITMSTDDINVYARKGSTLLGSAPIPANASMALIGVRPTTFVAYFFNSIGDIISSASVISAVSYEQLAISSVTIYGAQVTDWIFITNQDFVFASLADSDYQPIWNSNVYFLAGFAESISAGTVANGSIQNAIYKISKSGTSLAPLLKLSPQLTRMKDFGVKSGAQYSYEVFFVSSEGAYSTPVISNQICKQYNDISLYEATIDPDDPNIYHVLRVFRFSNNIDSQTISNNNTPSWQTNFTRYRLKQPTSRMGRSGTLSALLGSVNAETNTYSDTAEMMDKLFEASQSQNTFFMRDMKGNLYMVGISAPIQQVIDSSNNAQTVQVSVPWEEIGDIENISIIQTPEDEGWGITDNADLLNVKLYVNLDTGNLIAEYPDDYYGTEFSINKTNLIATTPIDVAEPTFDLTNGVLLATLSSD